MKRSLTVKTAVLLALAVLLPVMCSCSAFKKKEVLAAAAEFADVLKTADAGDIIRKTDGLEKNYKKSFRTLLNADEYSEEERTYLAHMFGSMTCETDDSTIEVSKDTASVNMTFSVTDNKALEGGDYNDINALADAVDKGSSRSVTIKVEFKEIDKKWYVTNFDSDGFKDLMSFVSTPMPVIGRSTLLKNAATVAESVIKDDPSLAISVAASYDSPDMIDMPAYLNNIFDVGGNPSDEDKAFRAALLATMSYEVDESTLIIDNQTGSVDIKITMADYVSLADQTFKKVSDIAPAVDACPMVTYTYTCHFVRNGADWYATDLDSEGFATFLLYKRFSVSMKNYDGTYTSSMDITDKFVAYVASEYNISMPSDLEGRIIITSTLVLKNGKYEVTVDRDAFVANIKTFVETNIDKIIMNMLGTTNSFALDSLAKVAGYKNYADMRQSVLNDVTTNLETINTSGLESSGTFTVNEDKITLKSGNDTMPGTIDNYGTITVTSPVNDADAKKLLGSDTVTLAYKKV